MLNKNVFIIEKRPLASVSSYFNMWIALVLVVFKCVYQGIDCSRGTNLSSRFATEQAGEYHRPEPVSIGPLYSVGVAEYVLPKSRVHWPHRARLVPQATSSNGELIVVVYCGMAQGQEHMPFPYFPLRWDKCVVHGTQLICQSLQA